MLIDINIVYIISIYCDQYNQVRVVREVTSLFPLELGVSGGVIKRRAGSPREAALRKWLIVFLCQFHTTFFLFETIFLNRHMFGNSYEISN